MSYGWGSERTFGSRRWESFVEVLRWTSAVSFLGFGLACVLTGSMAADFERFGLPRFRLLVGWLQALGGLGLLASLRAPWLLAPSSAGLSLLMLGGVIARIHAGDTLPATLPAVFFLAANLVLLIHALRAARTSRGAPPSRASIE